MTEHEVIIEFELKDEKITNSTDKIIDAFKEIKDSFSANMDKPVSQGLAEMADKSQKASKPLKELKKGAKGTALVIGVLATKSAIFAKKAIQLAQGSAEFVGTQTKFNAIFNRTNGELEQAQKWVDNYAKSLMLDNKAVMDTVSNFKLFANTLGLSNEKAKEITFNMTQLAHDMAAVAGVDVSTMAQKINSALAGQTKALKEYGISLDSNSLQQTLYQNNINRTVASLNSAEKAELIYAQIMKQTAGQQGYLAKTMLSPANAANILKTQFTLLGRSIGNLLLPIFMKLLPVVVAITQALTKAATALASFFGIKINFDNYGADIGGVSSGIDGIGESADGASKKMKNMLRDFDDLHVVDFGDDSSSGGSVGGGVGGAGGLGLDVQPYADWSKYLKTINTDLTDISTILVTMGTIFTSILITLGLLKKVNLYSAIFGDANILGVAGKLTLIIAGAIGLFVSMKNIITDNGNELKNVIVYVGSLAMAVGGVALMFGGIPALITAIAGAVALLVVETIKHWDSVKIFFEKIGTGFKEKIYQPIADFIGKIVNWIDTKVIQPILNFFKPINKAVFGIFSAIIKNTVEIATGIGKAIISIVSKIIEINLKIVEIIVALGKAFYTYVVSPIINFVVGIATTIWNTVISPVIGFFGYLWNGFYNGVIKPIWDKITWIHDKIWGLFKNVGVAIADFIGGTIKSVVNGVLNRIQSVINGFIRMLNASINIINKIPGVNISKLSLLNIPKFAEGGFPDKGDLFIANEREPELIGTMGNKTTVANSVQIIEGIAQASYNGMKRALQEVDFGTGDTLVYVGNKQLTDVVTKQQRMNNKKYGR